MWDNLKRKDELDGISTPSLRIKELCPARRKLKEVFLIVVNIPSKTEFLKKNIPEAINGWWDGL